MKIGYFTNMYPRATDTFIRREIAALRERGLEVRTFSVRRAGKEHEVGPDVLLEMRNTTYLLPCGVAALIAANLRAMIRVPGAYLATLLLAWNTRRPGWRGFAFQLIYFQEAILLAVSARRAGITHMHNHLGDNSGTVTLLFGRLTGIPYSITIHGPHIFFDPTHWALREKVRSSRFIACIGHYCQSQMMLFSDFRDWGRLNIVRCGVDLRLYQYREVRASARKLLYTGRLAVEKGLPILFESLRQLVANGYEVELTLLGDGEDRATLEALARQLGIVDKLTFAGYVDQDKVLSYLYQSDIFVLPSFAEGVPVSLMEAMACGVPVIATYVGGVVELVIPDQTGLVVPPSDSVALRAAIARYLDEPDLRRDLSHRARQRVAESYDIAAEAQKLAALFDGGDPRGETAYGEAPINVLL